MKFGCFSLDYRRFPLERAFRDAKRFGFTGLEIWGSRPHAYPFDMDREEIGKILQLQKDYGIEVPMYTPNALGMPICLCSLDKREQRDAQVYFKAAIDACAGIQSPRMLMVADHPGYTTPRAASWARFIENMQELAKYAAPKGVTLVIESLTPMESPVITTSDDCAQALADIGMENVEAMLDIVPPNIAYEPSVLILKKCPERCIMFISATTTAKRMHIPDWKREPFRFWIFCMNWMPMVLTDTQQWSFTANAIRIHL